jgi:hypothetical protein
MITETKQLRVNFLGEDGTTDGSFTRSGIKLDATPERIKQLATAMNSVQVRPHRNILVTSTRLIPVEG